MKHKVVFRISVAVFFAIGLFWGYSSPVLANLIVSLTVDGQAVDIPNPVIELNPETGQFTYLVPTAGLGNPEWEFVSNIAGLGNADPILSYTIEIVDSGDPSAFGFTFFIPTDPMGPYVTVASSISGSVTDGGDGAAGFTATSASGKLQENLFGGVNAGVDIGPSASGAGVYGPFGAGPTILALGGSGMTVMVNLMGSGGGDNYSINGSFEVEPATAPVPEPATMLLLGTGLVGVAGAARRRKKNQA